MKTHNPAALSSSFFVTGRLNVAAGEFLKRLEAVPALKASKSQRQTFMVNDPTGQSRIQVSANRLEYTYWFERKSLRLYTKHLIRFLSILSLIGESYQCDLATLYTSIMEVLTEQLEQMPRIEKIENPELLVRQLKSISDMNCGLSLKALELQSKLERFDNEKAVLVRFSKDVISGTLDKIGKDRSPEAMSRILGTTSETYNSTLLMTKE